MKVGDVSTAEITDATPAVLASHISLRGCQGPANMAPARWRRRRAGGLGSIAEQEIDHKVDVLLGGGRDRFAQTIASGPDAGKTVVQSAQERGYQLRHRRRRPQHRPERQQTGARPVQQKQHVAGVDRPGGVDRQGQRPGRLHRGPAPGQRAEPGGDDQAGRSTCSTTTTARASSSRSRAPRSTSRTTPPTPAARSARRSPSTGRSGSRSTTRRPPGHAGRRHRRPLAHQPDRRRGRERHRASRPATRPTC